MRRHRRIYTLIVVFFALLLIVEWKVVVDVKVHETSPAPKRPAILDPDGLWEYIGENSGWLHPKFPRGAPAPQPYKVDSSSFTPRQRRIVEAVRHAWDNYVKYAWGHDELSVQGQSFIDWGAHPLSGEGGIGLTAIEGLDTLWLTGQRNAFNEAILYLKTNHSFDVDAEVGLFETTIRVVGGLLSAYELSGEYILLEKAYDMGLRLLQTFVVEPDIPVPLASVNLRLMRASNPDWLGVAQQSLSEATTIQLEFKKLSYYTGDNRFDRVAQRAMKSILSFIDTQPYGLYSMFVMREDGSPTRGTITLGARGDSFYEYVAKQWLLTNRTDNMMGRAYAKIANGILDGLLVQMDPDHAFVAEAFFNENNTLVQTYKMDHLACFVSGMFQVAKHGTPEQVARQEKAARDIVNTCYQMYAMHPTHLAPEITRFARDASGGWMMFPSPGAYHYILRPETVESLFYMYRYTENQTWSDMAWRIFEAIEKHLKMKDGWVGTSDVTSLKAPPLNKMESFFLAETLKYLFLATGDVSNFKSQIPLDEWVFNTEAHPLRVMPRRRRKFVAEAAKK